MTKEVEILRNAIEKIYQTYHLATKEERRFAASGFKVCFMLADDALKEADKVRDDS